MRYLFQWLAQLLLWLTSLAIGIVFALLLAWQALVVGMSHSLTACLVLCVTGILIFLALIAVHELGHVIAGWAMGLPFARMTVGPLAVMREGERLRARLNTAWFQPAAYVMHGPTWTADVLLHWGVMTFGGPLSNLLLGAACLGAASWVNPGPPAEMPSIAREGWRNVALVCPWDLATAYLNLAGILSLGLGVSTLVPGGVRAWRTDGGQLLDLWRFPRVAQAKGYPISAVLFILAALGELCERRRKEQHQKKVLVTAREFCEYLLVCRGEETAAILRRNKLCRSEDVGRVIFGLVDRGLLTQQPSDSEADFRGLFVLEQT